MKRIFYITRSRLSFSRAHVINILKTAEVLAATKQYDMEVFSSAAEPRSADDIYSAENMRYPLRVDISPRRRFGIVHVWKQRNSFDILYFRDPFLWHIAFFARVFLQKRIVFEAHGSHEWAMGRPFWHASVFFAHGLVFITKELKEYYHPTKPYVVTHVRGITLQEFEDNRSLHQLRTELELPQGVPLIVYAGSFLWYSWEVLIQMMHAVPLPVMLILVGAKPEEKELIEEFAHKEGMEKRVRVIARVVPARYPSYILAADILVNPLRISYPGSVSSKIFEYLAAGKPIVSTGGKAMEEIIVHEKNALLVDLSAEQFGKAVVRILNNSPLAAKLSQEARESARRFTWEARARDIISLLDRI